MKNPWYNFYTMGFSFLKRNKTAGQDTADDAAEKVQDVFFDDNKEVLSLREKKLTIEFSRKALAKIYLEHRGAVLAIACIIVVGSYAIFSNSSKANTALFYATQCLGGWENPELAEGKPSLDDGAAGELFTRENAAILKNTQGVLYCGGFEGEIPKDSIPNKFIFHVSWTIDNGEVSHEPVRAVDPIDALPVETEVEVIVPEDDAATDEIKSEEEIKKEEEKKDEAKPEEKTPEPTAWQRLFGKRVLAQEVAEVKTEVKTEVQPEIKPEIKPETKIEAAGEVLPEIPVEEAGVENPSENTDDTIVILPPSAEPVSQDFMLIEYSFEGKEWYPLTYINPSNWASGSFDMPTNLATWENADTIQVRFSPTATIDSIPNIYLDAMWIEAEYTPIEDVKVENENNSDDKKLHAVSVVSDSEEVLGRVFKDSDQGEIIHITPGFGTQLVIFQKEDPGFSMMGPIGINGRDYPFYIFNKGTLYFVVTNDPDMCAYQTYEECSTGPDKVGTVTVELISLYDTFEPKEEVPVEDDPAVEIPIVETPVENIPDVEVPTQVLPADPAVTTGPAVSTDPENTTTQ